jgi:hypothetical protein
MFISIGRFSPGRPASSYCDAWSWSVCRVLAAIGTLTAGLCGASLAGEGVQLPLLLHETFKEGANRWQPFDPTGWRVEKEGDRAIYSQFRKETSYRPPHRSPFLISLLKDVVVSDLDLRLRVKSTHPDYGHRDVCIVFGYQSPARFYYVHLGKEMDDHANQIFVVDDAPRVKISTQTTDGTPWDDEWHDVRIVRNSTSGEVAVYFDDMENPVMRAKDDRFRWGQIGIGSFDDLSAWDEIHVYGRLATPESKGN